MHTMHVGSKRQVQSHTRFGKQRDKETQKSRMAPCFSASFQDKSLSIGDIPPANPDASTETGRKQNCGGFIHKIQ